MTEKKGDSKLFQLINIQSSNTLGKVQQDFTHTEIKNVGSINVIAGLSGLENKPGA